MAPFRLLVVLALFEFTGCSGESEPTKPLPKPTTALSDQVDRKGPANYRTCDKADRVIIDGREYKLPVECNREYFYTGDPPPDYALPEQSPSLTPFGDRER